MVKGIFRLYTAVCMLLSTTTAAYAQYPQVTDEAKHHADSLGNIAKRQRDSAWQAALPIVIQEAKEGRPYVPWASRPYDLRQAKIPAFPGAEGGGMFTFGGRGGRVLTVTNLNDSGPGSFRWACEQGGARIVVFNVSGIIRLKSSVNVRAPYITIAGQTAPEEGVCIAGESFCIDTHDVIVRHMRFRRGVTSVWSRDDAFGGNPVGNIMIDHCSCEWGLDGTPGNAEEMTMMHAQEPFEMAPLHIMGSEQVFDWVLTNVGATLPCRDIVDQRVIEEVRTGVPYYTKDYEKRVKDNPWGDMWGLAPVSQNSEGLFKYRRLPNDSYKLGIITDPRQMGGYPDYKSWQPYVDTDRDGMPDEWERQYGLNPNDPNDANGDLNGDGYTNIEKYINGINPHSMVDWRNLGNNYDTLAAKGKLL